MIRRDSLCNTGDTQEGVAYQIFDFVLHKNVIGQCNWQGESRKKEGRIEGVTSFGRQFDGAGYVTGM
jgi:hypothetical protein